jgi:hypothetical protein
VESDLELVFFPDLSGRAGLARISGPTLQAMLPGIQIGPIGSS